MSLPDIFSRRKRQASGQADVYQYDRIPAGFRVQLCHILDEAFGKYYEGGYHTPPANACYQSLVSIMRKEKQVFTLPPSLAHESLDAEFKNWLLNESNIDLFLDGLELSCRLIDNHVRKHIYQFRDHASTTPDGALSEINARLREAGFGYQYQSGQIIRVDSQALHSEVVVPALTLLANTRFQTAENEFLSAHASYRSGDYENCLLECGKAFESVLKIIGSKKGWGVSENDNAARLVSLAFASGFIPTALQAEFTALRSLLEAGVPVLRNKMSGHGAGNVPRSVPEHLAAFQLHQTAAVILFLIQHDAASTP